MLSAYWSIWNTVTRLGLAKPTAAELTLLILLGASLLALRTFRESYLKVWILGWTAFVASRLAEHCFAVKIPAPFDLVVVQTTFLLAVGLLAGAVLLYTRGRDLLLPLMVITPVLVGFGGAVNKDLALRCIGGGTIGQQHLAHQSCQGGVGLPRGRAQGAPKHQVGDGPHALLTHHLGPFAKRFASGL